MSMQDVIDRARGLILQIATPYTVGTGFYLDSHNLILTNEHIVRGNRAVVVGGIHLDRQLCRVLYLDSRLDLAFLEGPTPAIDRQLPVYEGELKEGMPVLVLGHSHGSRFASTSGIVSNQDYNMDGVSYLQHDAALNSRSGGSPLLTHEGALVGINAFVVEEGSKFGVALPIQTITKAIAEYQSVGSKYAVRCEACLNVLSEDKVESSYCAICGSDVMLPNQVPDYEAIGVNKTLEDTLVKLGHHVELARIGPHHWQIVEGSARITLSYHEESGIIVGDAVLAELPEDNIKPIYVYLLEENYGLDNLSLSVRGNEIILSLIIFDRYLNVESAALLMQHLFDRADHYDNILVERYGAVWQDPASMK